MRIRSLWRFGLQTAPNAYSPFLKRSALGMIDLGKLLKQLVLGPADSYPVTKHDVLHQRHMLLLARPTIRQPVRLLVPQVTLPQQRTLQAMLFMPPHMRSKPLDPMRILIKPIKRLRRNANGKSSTFQRIFDRSFSTNPLNSLFTQKNVR